ncbi:MAG: hypothetical protein R3B72_49795 [Polyangiaceae bacterium]
MRERMDEREELTPAEAYEAGYRCGLWGPDETSCHVGVLVTTVCAREWARGRQDGLARRVRRGGVIARGAA